MTFIFKISAKEPAVDQELAGCEFPTYESAEAAIQYLPNGIYQITKIFKPKTNH